MGGVRVWYNYLTVCNSVSEDFFKVSMLEGIQVMCRKRHVYILLTYKVTGNEKKQVRCPYFSGELVQTQVGPSQTIPKCPYFRGELIHTCSVLGTQRNLV